MSTTHEPVRMLLWCPECGRRHIDEGEFSTKHHHTHACQHCGHVWRPAIGATVGVQFLPGFKNDAPTDDLRSLVHELVGALALARPSSRGPGCWCEPSHDVANNGHLHACRAIISALERARSVLK